MQGENQNLKLQESGDKNYEVKKKDWDGGEGGKTKKEIRGKNKNKKN